MSDVLKKKPRMTCKQYCPVWNDIDKDCEIYGEHHFTPRTCPHYNIVILEKKMIERFIEENYDTQNTKNEQQKDLCITVEKQVWESTLHRSMVLEAENAHLKELLKRARGLMNCTKDWACTEATEELLTKIDEVLK